MKSMLRYAVGMASLFSEMDSIGPSSPRQAQRSRTKKPLTAKQAKARKKAKAARKARKRGK